ncbi:MAG: NUDIX hydrolase [Gammaproteobacteria bacterium]|nr:MAG: NUDIX hydrolase [Gammaproteobacteria bacterium]
MAQAVHPVQPIRPAATVIIVRDVGDPFEIFMLRRTSSAAFAGGMYVFPGGRVDGEDHLHAYDAIRRGPSDDQQAQQRALGTEWRGYWVAGIRETFEEAGLLLAYRGNGRKTELLAYADEAIRARFDEYRHAVHGKSVTLREVCQRESLHLAVDRIHYFNRWVTPLGRPRRFDTRFFIAEAPLGQTGQHDDKETDRSIWISPAEALARNSSDEFGLMAVTRLQLQTLAEFSSMAALHESISTQTRFPIHRPVAPRD